MAESYVVTGLVAKRAELAGRIAACRRELARLETDVGHLDGAIKLFAPDYKLESIRPKATGRGQRLFSPRGMSALGAGDLPRRPAAAVGRSPGRGTGRAQGTGGRPGPDRAAAQACLGCGQTTDWQGRHCSRGDRCRRGDLARRVMPADQAARRSCSRLLPCQ